ncbi:MAG: hypothetical protein KBD17_02090 [Candidatus Pacebacteria bacterium]|nr:hypothetical protein [Candidatus Paceibacterota bacterium]
MENQNLMEQTKSPSSMKTFVIVLLLIVLFYYAIVVWKKNEKARPVLDELASTQQLEIITSSEVLKVPEILSEKDITFTGLPKYIQSLFTEKTDNLVSKSVKYKDGTSGFSVAYVSDSSIRNAYVLMQENSKTTWPPLDGGRTAGAAFLNIEHESYFIRAEFLKLEDIRTAVKVAVINK